MTQAMGNGSPSMRWSEACEPYASLALELDLDAFSSRFDQTYLCFVTGEPNPKADMFGTDDAGPPVVPVALQVLPLVKSTESGPFDLMITFGRAPSNDLQVPFSDVSKLHGYFSLDSKGWSITDAGSTNGTFLDGSRLRPRQPAPVEIGGQLGLASVEARVLDGAALHAFLQPQLT